MSWRALMIVLFLAALPGVATAVEPSEILNDPVLEARARDISKELRCLVCQNQSIDDSDAGLARDLRVLVRERLVGGDSDTEVIAFITARYGDFVLLRPPFKAATMALWLGPAVIFLAGAIGATSFIRRRRSLSPMGALSEDEQRRLARLLGEDGDRAP